MNQRPDDPNKHGEVVTIDGPQLPAVIKKNQKPVEEIQRPRSVGRRDPRQLRQPDPLTGGDRAAKARPDGGQFGILPRRRR